MTASLCSWGVSQYVNVCVGSDLLGKGQHHVEVSVTLQRLVLLEGVSVHSRSGIKMFFQFSCSVFEITVSWADPQTLAIWDGKGAVSWMTAVRGEILMDGRLYFACHSSQEQRSVPSWSSGRLHILFLQAGSPHWTHKLLSCHVLFFQGQLASWEVDNFSPNSHHMGTQQTYKHYRVIHNECSVYRTCHQITHVLKKNFHGL